MLYHDDYSDLAEWAKPTPGVIPDSFRIYHKMLMRLLRTDPSGGREQPHLKRLAPSVRQLARIGEETREFVRLVKDLRLDTDELEELNQKEYEKLSETGLDSQKIDMYASVSDAPRLLLKTLLRRSGYYHAMLAGENPEPYWQRVVDRIQWGYRRLPCFWLLAGCEFPRNNFELAGFSVVRMGDSELQALGAASDVYDDFFQSERLPKEFQDCWFLKISDETIRGYANGREWLDRFPEKSAEEREVERVESEKIHAAAKAALLKRKYPRNPVSPENDPEPTLAVAQSSGGLKLIRTAEIAVNRTVEVGTKAMPPLWGYSLLKPLLLLALYNPAHFDVSSAFIADPGWRIQWGKRTDHWSVQYRVNEGQWANFQEFAQLAKDGITRLTPNATTAESPPIEKYQRKFQIAVGRYLRATFATGHQFFPSLEGAYTGMRTASDTFVPLDYRGQPDQDSLVEEVLLQYMFCLEAALLDKNEPSHKKADYLKVRAARLIGREDEREAISEFVGKMYQMRNVIAHGELLPTRNLHLQEFRIICQRVLGSVLLLTVSRKWSHWKVIKNLLEGSKDHEEAVQRARDASVRLLLLTPDDRKWKEEMYDDFERPLS